MEVRTNFTWTTRPLVRLCRGSAVDPWRVEQAMAWWGRRGAVFAGLEVTPCAFREDGTPLADDPARGAAFNTITITHVGQLDATCGGRTRWALYGDVPLWAVVSMPATGGQDLALEHELGHALGYAHVEMPGHVMYPTREKLGPGAYGLAEVGTISSLR